MPNRRDAIRSLAATGAALAAAAASTDFQPERKDRRSC
jgi:hypothetical protein